MEGMGAGGGGRLSGGGVFKPGCPGPGVSVTKKNPPSPGRKGMRQDSVLVSFAVSSPVSLTYLLFPLVQRRPTGHPLLRSPYIQSREGQFTNPLLFFVF